MILIAFYHIKKNVKIVDENSYFYICFAILLLFLIFFLLDDSTQDYFFSYDVMMEEIRFVTFDHQLEINV